MIRVGLARWGKPQFWMIRIKSEREIEAIRESCRLVSLTLRLVVENIRPGVTTELLDRIVEDFIKSMGARSAFKGFRGFPANICVSIDEEVVHGIPGKRRLSPGELVSVDVGVEKNGYYGDAAATLSAGDLPDEKKRLVLTTKEALYKGIEKAVEGNRLFDISHAIQNHVESMGYSVVRDLVGHGIGREMHEEPQVPNFGQAGCGPRLKRGMVLAIEPMVSAGGHEVRTLDDNWTVVTLDGSPAAHFEHTVAITQAGPDVLTELGP